MAKGQAGARLLGYGKHGPEKLIADHHLTVPTHFLVPADVGVWEKKSKRGRRCWGDGLGRQGHMRGRRGWMGIGGRLGVLNKNGLRGMGAIRNYEHVTTEGHEKLGGGCRGGAGEAVEGMVASLCACPARPGQRIHVYMYTCI